MPKFPREELMKLMADEVVEQEKMGVLDDKGDDPAEDDNPMAGLQEVFGPHVAEENHDIFLPPVRTVQSAPAEPAEREDVLGGLTVSMPEEVPNG